MTHVARRNWIRVRRYAWALAFDLAAVGAIVAVGWALHR